MACEICSILAVLLSVGCGRGISEDVFASSAQLRMLDEGEKDLINTVNAYVSSERQKLETIERLIAEVEDSRKTSGYNVPITNHPIDVFHLIHRFTTTWRKSILPLVSDTKALDDVRSVAESMREIMPTEYDYEGAKSAIIRLQRTYHLPVHDVINGSVLGQTTRPMSQQMAVDVALFASSRKLPDDALAWLTHAQNHLLPPLTPLQDIYHAAGRIHAQKGELLQAVDFVKKALELDPSNSLYLSSIMPEDSAADIEWPFKSDRQDDLCRELLVKDKISFGSTLSCSFQRGTVVPFQVRKVEHLYRSPDVVLHHDFITDNEANQLQLLAKSKIKRATIGGSLASLVSEGRVGKIAWFFDGEGDQLIERISKRISVVTGLQTKHPSAEAIQLSNYGLGGHYSVHYDHDPDRYKRTNPAADILQSGDRMATFMIYLNNVEAGGATVFPELGIGTRPVKNAALFWYNYKRSGFSEPMSLHAACPVLIGEKWVANKWIREFGQEFRRTCDLSIDV